MYLLGRKSLKKNITTKENESQNEKTTTNFSFPLVMYVPNVKHISKKNICPSKYKTSILTTDTK